MKKRQREQATTKAQGGQRTIMETSIDTKKMKMEMEMEMEMKMKMKMKM